MRTWGLCRGRWKTPWDCWGRSSRPAQRLIYIRIMYRVRFVIHSLKLKIFHLSDGYKMRVSPLKIANKIMIALLIKIIILKITVFNFFFIFLIFFSQLVLCPACPATATRADLKVLDSLRQYLVQPSTSFMLIFMC